MKKYFKIKQTSKIKFFSKPLSILMFWSAIGIFMFYIFLVPSERTPGDIKVLFFIKFFPTWLQYFIVYSLIIFPISWILYSISNYTKKGIIYFDIDRIRIKTWRKNVSIPVKELTNIIFVDQSNFLNTTFSFRFVLQTSWDRVYRLQLLETERMDELIETIQFYKTMSERLKISAELTDPTFSFEDSN
jgi:hypothetical protein